MKDPLVSESRPTLEDVDFEHSDSGDKLSDCEPEENTLPSAKRKDYCDLVLDDTLVEEALEKLVSFNHLHVINSECLFL